MSVIGNSPGVASQRVVSPFTATSGQTTFTPISGYTLGYCDVFLNGIKLANGDDYTASDGTTVVLAVGAALGDFVEVVAYFPRGLSDGYLKSEADAKFVALTGDQNIAGAKKFTGSVIIGRVNSAEEGGQIDLCRSSDNASAWAIDVFGSTSTPSLRVVDNIASATRMQFDSSGNVEINNGNLKLASGKGISFPAVTSGSSDANTLDDYEEGTWSPSFGSNWSGTYSIQQAFYTKIGRQVTVYGRATTNGGSGSWTANLFPSITNLPFSSQSVAGSAVNGSWGFATGVTGLASPNIGAGNFDGAQNGGTSAFPNMFRVGDNISNMSTNNLSNSVNCEMRFQITYFTS